MRAHAHAAAWAGHGFERTTFVPGERPKKSWERYRGRRNNPLAVSTNLAPVVLRLRSARLLGLVLALTPACDSGDGDSGAADTEADETDSGGDGGGESEGNARITVTVDDGTVYELDVRSCDTSVTDPSGFPLSNGYVVSGLSTDGSIDLFVSRAGFDDEPAMQSGSIEGDFDEDGQNARMIYAFAADTFTLQIDGANVSGSASARAVGPTRTHGDNPVFTIDARCE